MAFHFPHGVVLSQWTPGMSGPGYAITPGLAPIAMYQKDFNVISGLQQSAWNKGPGGGHANGFPNFATAVPTNGQGAGGPSFDQVLAAELGAATRFRSIVANNEQPGSAAELDQPRVARVWDVRHLAHARGLQDAVKLGRPVDRCGLSLRLSAHGRETPFLRRIFAGFAGFLNLWDDPGGRTSL